MTALTERVAAAKILLSGREAAQVLGVGRGKGRGLRELVAMGVLTPVPWIGGRVRYALEEIQRIAREGVPGNATRLRPSRQRARVAPPARGVGGRIRALRIEGVDR